MNKLNVDKSDISKGRKSSRGIENRLGSPGLAKIQEMLSARSKNKASYSSKSMKGPHSRVNTKKKRKLNIKPRTVDVTADME